MINRARKKIYIALLIFVLLAAMGVGLIWQFLWLPLVGLGENYRTDRLELSTLEQKADLLKDLKKDLQVISESVDTIKSSFLGKEDILFFLESIEGIAQTSQNSYTVRAVEEVSANSSKSTPEAILLNAEIKGTFPNLLLFFRGLTELPYLMNIDEFSLEKSRASGDGEESDLIKVIIRIKVYTR